MALATTVLAFVPALAGCDRGEREAVDGAMAGEPAPAATHIQPQRSETHVRDREPPAPDTQPLPPRFGFGRPAKPEEVTALDIDVMPDGRALPPGRGTVAKGAKVYAAKCAQCHGRTGTEGPADVLVGREPREGFPFGQSSSLTRTIGNYWPYATTLYDYVNRAMPFDRPGSLKPDEIYSLVAWLLHRNEIVPEDAVMDAKTLPAVNMPARDHFVPDDRKGGAEVR